MTDWKCAPGKLHHISLLMGKKRAKGLYKAEYKYIRKGGGFLRSLFKILDENPSLSLKEVA